MPISNDKVLIVVNSDEPISQTVADYYIAARGLTPHIVTLSLGSQTLTNTRTATYAQVVQVADYMIANAIEAVICSAKCPTTIATNGHVANFENVLGAAKFYKSNGGLPVLISGNIPYSSSPLRNLNGTTIYGFGFSLTLNGHQSDYFIRPKFGYNWKDTQVVPFGRIGIPKYNSYFPVETYESSIYFVNAALANEQTHLSAKGLPIHYLLDGRTDAMNNDYSCNQARLVAEAVGLSTYTARDVITDNGVTGIMPSYLRTSFDNGTVSLPLWGLMGFYSNGGMFTNGIASPNQNSYTLLPGSWGCGGASNGLYGPGSILLNRGMVAFSGCGEEPWVYAMMCCHSFMQSVTIGNSIMESAAYSNMIWGWMASTWGDPLYRPFGKQNVTLVG